MEPWFWFGCLVIDWAGRSFQIALPFCIIREYVTLMILIAQQVFQSHTSMAEEKKMQVTCRFPLKLQCVCELQLVHKAILNNFVCEKKYLNVYCHFFVLLCHALVFSSLSLPDYTVVKVSHEV